jgi:hypothetical protein
MLSRKDFENKLNDPTLDSTKWDFFIDEHIGIDFNKIEQAVPDHEGLYKGLKSEALQTSYLDYYQILQKIPSGSSFVDIGAGYNRASFVNHWCDFGHDCIGLEVVKERIVHAQSIGEKFGINSKHFVHFDLYGSHELPKADFYFIYMPTGVLLDQIFVKLSGHKHSFQLIVIESHGDLIPTMEHYSDWFKCEFKIPLSQKRHDPFIYFYQSRISMKNDYRPLEDFIYWVVGKRFNSDYELVIMDQDIGAETPHYWTASLLDSSFYWKGNYLMIESKYPFRIFPFSAVREVRLVSKQDVSYKKLAQMRFNDQKIGKIIIKPELQYEKDGKRITFS